MYPIYSSFDKVWLWPKHLLDVNINVILQSHLTEIIFFFRCTGVTDLGISAIASGCPDLEMINTAYCTSITDRALFCLSKCANLQTLEIRGCLLVTSIGLASISMNCKQLSRLDIKKCYNIDDSGMIPLAHFSQNLRQVFIFAISQFRAKHKKCMKALIRILMLCLFS
jgi:hypothetical protein